jgi:two-component system, cell cycle response regulator DivK
MTAKKNGRSAKKATNKIARKGRGLALVDKLRDQPLVLVVDDYADAREMYCEYLEFSGFEVAEAKNGLEALDQANKLLPDIILMDLSLPAMDGWEATRRLKADDRTRAIPVVALTGHALAGFSEGAKKAGCDAFVTKPCLPDALVSEVRRILDQSKKPLRARSRN